MPLTKQRPRSALANRWFAALAWLILILLFQLSAADFPRELVEFEPYAENPIFTGAGPGHWDVKIRERGWIARGSRRPTRCGTPAT